MIIEEKLGKNILHRMRNRIASKILEPVWVKNYAENKWLLPKSLAREKLPHRGDTALVVGAGPSLADNLEVLKTLLMDRITTIVCDKSLPRLPYDIRCKVDMVTALNAENPDIVKWWRESHTTNPILVAPMTADPRTFNAWAGEYSLVNLALPIDLTERITKETGLKPTTGGSNTGVFSYLLAGKLEFKNIILVGFDYSFKTREEAVQRIPKGEPYMLFEGTGRKGEVRWATWDWFDSTLSFFEYARFFRKNGIRTFNCSGDGIVYDGEFIEDCTLAEVVKVIG